MYDSQYQHSYLLLGLAFLGVWTLLYVRRRDVRKKMRIMSTIVAVMGPIADTVYVQDWWSPLIVINTEVGFEPILAGFAIPCSWRMTTAFGCSGNARRSTAGTYQKLKVN